MIDRDHKLSVSRQARVLGISRGSVYYLPRLVSDADLKLMRRIDHTYCSTRANALGLLLAATLD